MRPKRWGTLYTEEQYYTFRCRLSVVSFLVTCGRLLLTTRAQHTDNRQRASLLLHRPLGVVQRCQVDSVPCGDGLDLSDPLGSDEPSPLREGLEAALQSEGDPFEEASVDHVGERMAIQNSMKIRRERQAAGDLSQTSEEDSGARHVGPWREVLRVAGIADDCMLRDPSQKERRRGHARGADHDAGFGAESLEGGGDLHMHTICLQLRREPSQPLHGARAKHDALHERIETTRATWNDNYLCSDDV